MKRSDYQPTRADGRAFWFIMLPTLAEGVLNYLFGMIDTVMLGHTVNSAVNISAASIANTAHQFLYGVTMAFLIGATASIAFYVGQNKPERVGATTRQTILVTLLASLLMMGICLIFAPEIVYFTGAKGELHEGATIYFRIVVAGFPFLALTTAATACMRGIGVTRIAMIYNILSGAANVVGNYALIYGRFGCPEMGIAGAALSTTLSRALACGIAIVYLFVCDSPIRLTLRASYRFTRDGLGRVCTIGVTTAMEQVILQGGNILATKFVASMDTVSIAAFNVCTSIGGLTWVPGQACQVASTTFTGQDLGAGQPQKARARTLMVLRYSMYFCGALSLFMIFFRNPIARLYSPETEIWSLAGEALICEAVSVVGTTLHLVLSGSLRSAGDQKYPLIASLVSLWTARVVLQFILMKCGMLTVLTARGCILIDQLIRGSIVTHRFIRSDKYKSRKDVEQSTEVSHAN